MSLTPTDLLKQRVKMIALAPLLLHEVGDIFEVNTSGDIFIETIGDECYIPFADYPANFKALKWWEERTGDELPEYVKWDNSLYPTWNKVYKVTWFSIKSGSSDELMNVYSDSMLPATKEEYDNYIIKKSNIDKPIK